MSVDPNVKLYTPAEIAEILHLSTEYVRVLIRTGKLPASVHKRGRLRCLYVTGSDLYTFMHQTWLIPYAQDKKRSIRFPSNVEPN